MNIGLLVVYYMPSTESCVQLIYDLAHELKSRGHRPIVITVNSGILGDVEITNEQGVRVMRVRAGKIKGTTRYMRALTEFRLSRIVWSKAHAYLAAQALDLIIYYSPSIFWGSLVKRLKEVFACKSYLILRDIFPQWYVDTGIIRKGLLYCYLKRKELESYDAADVIGVQSPANVGYFMSGALRDRYRVEVLFNWSSLEPCSHPRHSVRSKLGLEDKIIFIYGGNMGVAQDMDNIVRLAARLSGEARAYFLLVGDGSEVHRVKREIQKRKLRNVSIHPAVSQEEYMGMVAESDIGLISLDRRLKTQNFPGKMLGYMYHAKPILASINEGNDLEEILNEHGAGLVCHNGDDEAFYNHAIELIRMPVLRERMGKSGRMLLEERFSASRAASQILSHFTN
jgi:glycosyltransferase involved in cell wall biosynthesis